MPQHFLDNLICQFVFRQVFAPAQADIPFNPIESTPPQDYEEDLQELSEIKTKAQRLDLAESKGATRLFNKVNRMLGKLDR